MSRTAHTEDPRSNTYFLFLPTVFISINLPFIDGVAHDLDWDLRWVTTESRTISLGSGGQLIN